MKVSFQVCHLPAIDSYHLTLGHASNWGVNNSLNWHTDFEILTNFRGFHGFNLGFHPKIRCDSWSHRAKWKQVFVDSQSHIKPGAKLFANSRKTRSKVKTSICKFAKPGAKSKHVFANSRKPYKTRSKVKIIFQKAQSHISMVFSLVL